MVGGLHQIGEVFLGQALYHLHDALGAVFQNAHQGLVQAPHIHDPHNEDKNKEDGTDNGHCYGLEEGPGFLACPVLPDNFIRRGHRFLIPAILSIIFIALHHRRFMGKVNHKL